MLFKLSIFLCLISLSLSHPEDEHKAPPSSREIKEALYRTEQVQRSCKLKRAACVLTQEEINGPYYVQLFDLYRYNITEGTQTGIPMIIQIQVIDVTTCEPVPDATIDIWHANATGVYSHINQNGNLGGATTTFLRGLQNTNSSGYATMASVITGWYEGRAVHTHLKVHFNGSISSGSYSGGSVVHTGQLFFTQDFMNSYATISPYSTNTQSRTTLASDMWYPYAGAAGVFDVTYLDSTVGVSGGIIASAVVAINTTFVSTGETDQLTNYTETSASNSNGPSSGPPSSGMTGTTTTTANTTTTAAATSTSTVATTTSKLADESSTSVVLPFLALILCAAIL